MPETDPFQELRDRASKYRGVNMAVLNACIEEVRTSQAAAELREFILYAPKEVHDVWKLYEQKHKVKEREQWLVTWVGLGLAFGCMAVGISGLVK